MKRRRKKRPFSPRDHRLYAVFYGMLARCYNPRCPMYRFYGLKGVRMCGLWERSFDEFCSWAKKNGYKKGLEIDRINPFGDYVPWNCRWVTQQVGRQNTRKNYREKMRKMYGY